MHKSRVYLIDATAFCYRAFYAIRGLATSSGQPTNAIFGFVRMLQKILKQYAPEYLAVCFDVSRKTFRQEKYAAYKAQRQAMPDGLSSQMPIIKRIIKAYGIRLFEQEGFEADDIIATLAAKARRKSLPVAVVSSDKDLMQLVDEGVVVVNPGTDDGEFDVARVNAKFGVAPAQIPDLIALLGDSVDNIPAVKGVSEKKAQELVRTFGSVEKILSQTETVVPDKLRALIDTNAEQIRLNKDLASLQRDMDLDFDLEALKIDQPDYQQLYNLFKELEFKAFLKDLPVTGKQDELKAQAVVLEDKDVRAAVKGHGAITVYALSGESLTLGIDGKIYTVPNMAGQVQAVLADPEVKKIGHDLKKLKIVLKGAGMELSGLWFDIMIAGYLVNPARSSFSLEDLAWEYLKKTVDDAASDGVKAVSLIMTLQPVFERLLRENGLEKLFTATEMPLVDVLAGMELCGIRLDTGKLARLSRDLEKKLAHLIEEIYALCGCQFNINSPKQLQRVLFEELKLPVVKRTKTGASTDEEVLRTLAAQHPLPRMLLEYRQLTKLKSTYIDALPEMVNPASGRVHTSFNQTGTETGRLSSSNPNLQNIPIKTELGRSIREAIIAFSGKSCLLSCDYSQIELRVLAHLSGDKTLISAFKQGHDIHKKTAALIYDIDEKEVSDQQRTVAKRVNFGIVYGLSAFGLARDLEIPLEQAQRFIEAYFVRYPGVKAYIGEQIVRAEKEGFVTTILGRRRYLPEIKDRNQSIRQFAQRQAINTPIQGSASDMIKMAMVRIQHHLQSQPVPGTMILQIHDELLFDVARTHLEQFGRMVKECMEHVFTLEVPVVVDMQYGANWAQMQPFQ
ncbi:MAG TPA: DNA polymerase I [Candidatus Omnitrophota bacterium]|nr:DNA polymerase I [Candidatus Omnitrophota bacterium]HRZ14965.1 DNA polymerase I [Candidatus Omnitrophota bacterium]